MEAVRKLLSCETEATADQPSANNRSLVVCFHTGGVGSTKRRKAREEVLAS
jgi:hypothetical protein